ncbi:hypothetical protein ACQ661_02310 [Pseudidiomarina sp. WS423]|uniref:hypothetical protein n=1 Tax=Pseudidiomarina sp. WS423 TaxID=3425124 RepID=UPI003D6FD0F4
MRHFFLLSSLLFLAGCTAAPYFQAPAPALNANQEISYQLFTNESVKTASHMQVHLDEAKDIAYVQSFGGGGVAVGVAFGPLGVLANIGMIQAETDADLEQLYGKLPLPVADMFSQAATKQAMQHNANSEVRFHPFVLVVRDEDEMLRMGTALIVEVAQADGSVWGGRYTHQTSLHLPLADIADGMNDTEHTTVHGALEQSFEEILALYLNDRMGNYIESDHVVISSTFLSPRFKLEVNGKVLERHSDRVTLRSGAGLISLPLDDSLTMKNATVKKPKASSKS